MDSFIWSETAGLKSQQIIFLYHNLKEDDSVNIHNDKNVYFRISGAENAAAMTFF